MRNPTMWNACATQRISEGVEWLYSAYARMSMKSSAGRSSREEAMVRTGPRGAVGTDKPWFSPSLHRLTGRRWLIGGARAPATNSLGRGGTLSALLQEDEAVIRPMSCSVAAGRL